MSLFMELNFDDENSFKYELWRGMKPLMLMEGFHSSCLVSIQLTIASKVHCTEKPCSLLQVKQCCKQRFLSVNNYQKKCGLEFKLEVFKMKTDNKYSDEEIKLVSNIPNVGITQTSKAVKPFKCDWKTEGYSSWGVEKGSGVIFTLCVCV